MKPAEKPKDETIDPMQLSAFVPIKTLSPDHLQELANKSQLLHFRSGRFLFKQDEPLKWICYVLQGSVELINQEGPSRVVMGGTKSSTLPLEQNSTHQCSARAKDDVTVINVDPNLLDIMLTWQQSGGYEVQELEDATDDAGDDWMSRLLQAQVFHRIPPANIQSIFMRIEAQHFSAGEAVIKQGEEGDRFYLIREGACKVVRQTRKNPEGVVLAQLTAGDNFGEEALISGGKRNASIVMTTDGVLMSLTKSDFLELMNEPLLHWLSYSEAKQVVDQNEASWIDVRLPAEFQSRHIPGSINIPLPILRAKLSKLDATRKYIVICDTGRRSSTATYLITQYGIDAYVLKDGLRGVAPEELAA